MNKLVSYLPASMFLAARVTLTTLTAVTLLALPLQHASAQVAPPQGTAAYFAVLAGAAVTNTGSTVINGSLAVSPGTSVTGFPPGVLAGGAIHSADAVAAQAQQDSSAAYQNLAGQTCETSYGVPTDIGGLTLTPGVYCFSSTAQLTGVLTLDAAGDPNAVWVFQVGSTLTTASASSVVLINGAKNCNVFWQVGSSATLGTSSSFVGNIFALSSITLTTSANVSGRVQALNGAVTLDTNNVAVPICTNICQQGKFCPGNLVVSRTVYNGKPSNVTAGGMLPPMCSSTQAGCAGNGGAPSDGTYPALWNNVAYDSSFGIATRIYLDQLDRSTGKLINTLEVPNSLAKGVKSTDDQLVTSFSSPTELALNLSADNYYLSFMGYVAPVGVLDVSKSNTSGAMDATNPVGTSYPRAAATVDKNGVFHFTNTNAFSGNSPRAAFFNNAGGLHNYYLAGGSGNGSSTQPNGVILGAGAQMFASSTRLQSAQNPNAPSPAGSFSISQTGAKADSTSKDNDFRGLAVHNNVLYYTKGGGADGVNSVYFLDTTGQACPNGVGLPSTSATLPGQPLAYNLATLQSTGLPSNLCILAGFPSTPNRTASVVSHPFGMWFANDNTLYVADEGDSYTGGTDLYTHAAAQTTAGLQKWVFSNVSQTWQLVYTLQTGLNLGKAYIVPRYPTGNNTATGLPWAPATDGLRNLVGRVNAYYGLVSIWAITSTVSGNGDIGADPNKLVVISDVLTNTDPALAATEQFYDMKKAAYSEVLRGVSFSPKSNPIK